MLKDCLKCQMNAVNIRISDEHRHRANQTSHCTQVNSMFDIVIPSSKMLNCHWLKAGHVLHIFPQSSYLPRASNATVLGVIFGQRNMMWINISHCHPLYQSILYTVQLL